MGVEGCTKCIKYLLFVFNFVFWVSPAGTPRQAPNPLGRAFGDATCGWLRARFGDDG